MKEGGLGAPVYITVSQEACAWKQSSTAQDVGLLTHFLYYGSYIIFSFLEQFSSIFPSRNISADVSVDHSP